MSFVDRSYSGKISRPAPETHIEEDGSFGVIATPWGNRQAAKHTIEILTDYVLSARQDMEATSPFQKLTCLSGLANNLRAGVMLANDSLYREENKNEHVAGVELLVFASREGEVAFAHVGAPHFLLARRGLPWIPLSMQIDLATEMSGGEKLMAPLPQNMIGLHNTSNMHISSFKTRPGDRLVFLSHSLPSLPIFSLDYENTDLDSISQLLSKKYPDLPFWAGIFEVS